MYHSDSRKEIWASDGRAAGTQKLLDLGAAGFLKASLPQQNGLLLIIDRNDQSAIYFSDGTVAGTRLLLETPSTLYFPILFKNTLYYASNNGNDFGDTDGLYALPLSGPKYEAKSIYGFERVYGISQLTALADRIIGVGSFSGQGQQLFSSDGSTQGTKAYFQLNAGIPASLSDPIYSTPAGNQLFFFYQTSFNGLYVTDGTAAGTKLLGRYKKHKFQYPYQATRSFYAWAGKFFFSADTLSSDPFSSEVLNVSNGTTTGTYRIAFGGQKFTKPHWFTPYQGELFFKAYGNADSEHLCVSAGTPKETYIAIDHYSLGEGGSFGGDDLCVFRDSLFFSASRRAMGQELWYSNGYTSGTKVHDLWEGSASSWPQQLTVLGDKLFFTAISASAGRELWVYDPKRTLTSSRVVSELKAQLKLVPNPAQDRVLIQAETAEPLARFVVYDVLGRPYYQAPLQGQQMAQTLELQNWPRGIYVLELWAANGSRKVEKLMLK
jgi:ELWxxDGT repeat protein